MKVNLKNLVSITEANQNFSKVARMVDDKGVAVIMKNNVPRYVVISYNDLQDDIIADDMLVQEAAAKYLLKHDKAFKELSYEKF